MSNKKSDSPDVFTYAGAIAGILLVIYLISTSFDRPHGPSPIIDGVVLLMAIAVGFVVMFFAASRLFPNGEKDVNKSNMTRARIKMGAVMLLSMLASGAIAFIYYFIF